MSSTVGSKNNHLTLPAQVLYFRLLNVFNRAGWPEWVPVDTIRLQVMTNGLSKPSAYRARDELVKAGFIRYQQGKKGPEPLFPIGTIKFCIDSLQETLHKPLQFPLQNPLQETLPIYKTKTKTKEKTPTESKRKVFVPPTVDEVREYCLARKKRHRPAGVCGLLRGQRVDAGEGQNERLESCCADVGEAQEGGNR